MFTTYVNKDKHCIALFWMLKILFTYYPSKMCFSSHLMCLGFLYVDTSGILLYTLFLYLYHWLLILLLVFVRTKNTSVYISHLSFFMHICQKFLWKVPKSDTPVLKGIFCTWFLCGSPMRSYQLPLPLAGPGSPT